MEELTRIQTALKAWFWEEAFMWPNQNLFKQQHEQPAGRPSTSALQAATNMLSSMPQLSLSQGRAMLTASQQRLGSVGAGTAVPAPRQGPQALQGLLLQAPRMQGPPCRCFRAPRTMSGQAITQLQLTKPWRLIYPQQCMFGTYITHHSHDKHSHGVSAGICHVPLLPLLTPGLSPRSIPMDMLGKTWICVHCPLGKPGHCRLFYFGSFCLKLCSSEAITLWARFCFQNFPRTISKHSR